jgi:TRAP-type mannitol/chloroaromatic compound transport system substrate-binding protein
MKKISRKNCLKKSSMAALGSGVLINACNTGGQQGGSRNIVTGKKHKWKMVTTWPPNFPVLGEGCNYFADWVREMSNGRLDIKVYGAGELIPAMEAFDAVSSGTAEIGNGAAYYWAGKSQATQFFATVPFGMNAQQMNSWLYSGGGLELWKELYERFNVIPMPGGNTGVQMGGWYIREINTIEDFKGLKMRIPGLGGKVLEKVGGTAVLSAGSEIYTNLERGVIDATEWIGPYHDYKMGFNKIAKYYYSPGWHEPGAVLEFFINKRKFEGLEKDLQAILETASYRLNLWTLSEFEAQNAIYLQKIKDEGEVEIRSFSTDILSHLKTQTLEVLSELAAQDPFIKKIYESYSGFRKQAKSWSDLTEKAYYNNVG